MSFFQKYKNIILIAILAILAIVAYFSFFRSGGDTGEELLSVQVESAGTEAQSELLALLIKLKTLRLDPTLFTDPRFISLTDFSIPLQPQPSGRANPFLPIGADAIAAVSTATGTPAAATSSPSGTATTTGGRSSPSAPGAGR